ncbi:MAG: phosphatase PAP2 family protein [archaeon]
MVQEKKEQQREEARRQRQEQAQADLEGAQAKNGPLSLREHMLRGGLIISVFLVLAVSSFALDPAVHSLASILRSPALTFIMGIASYPLTLLLVPYGLMSFLLLDMGRRRHAVLVWVIFILTIIVSYLIKLSAMRVRPDGLVMDVPLLGLPDYSFPSTHAALSFAPIPLLGKDFPSLRWFWVLFGLIVIMSRIYLGYHFFSDVVCGAGLGIIIGMLTMSYGPRIIDAIRKAFDRRAEGSA